MKYYILLFSLLLVLPICHSANLMQLSANQYFDFETGVKSNSNSADMDVRCYNTYSNANAPSTLITVNDARAIVNTVANVNNLTAILGYRWANNYLTNMSNGTLTGIRYGYFYTHEGNYIKIVSDTVSLGFCEFNNFTESIGIRKTSEISNSPFFGAYINATNYTTFNYYTWEINDTNGFAIDSRSMGLYFTNVTTNIPIGFSGFIYPSFSSYSPFNDSFSLTPSSLLYTLYPTSMNPITYMNTEASCSTPRNSALNSSLGNWYYQGELIIPSEMMCIYPMDYLTGKEINNNRTYDYEYQINLENNTLLFHLNDLYDTFIESSNQTNNGICYNCPTLTNGVLGNARQFNGTSADYIDTNNNTWYNETLTLMAWVKLDNNPLFQDSFQNDIISLDGSWFMGQRANVTGSTELVGCMFDDVAVLSCGYSWGFQIPNDTWTHVAVTFNQPMQRIRTYANGQLINEQATTMSQFAYSPTEITISDPYARSVKGDIDEVAVFSSELSADQISRIYQKQSDSYLRYTGIDTGIMFYDYATSRGSTAISDYKIVYSYWNSSTFNKLYNIFTSPIEKKNGIAVKVLWLSTNPGNSTVYWRSRNVTQPDTATSYSQWFFYRDDTITSLDHMATINSSYIIGDRYYQFYIETSGIIENNSGLYYNFTVGGLPANVNATATIPQITSRLEATGFCSGATCRYTFGAILLGILAIAGFFFGGKKLGFAIILTGLVVMGTVDMLPFYVIIPIVLFVVIKLVQKFHIIGGEQ